MGRPWRRVLFLLIWFSLGYGERGEGGGAMFGEHVRVEAGHRVRDVPIYGWYELGF